MTSSTSAANLVNGNFTEEPLKRLARVKVGNMTKGKGIPRALQDELKVCTVRDTVLDNNTLEC